MREIAPRVHVLPLPVSNVYLWDWGDGLTLIDTGIPGSADAILTAITRVRQPSWRSARMRASWHIAPILGPFNVDRLAAIEAVRTQARLDFEVACVAHGEPIVGNARNKLLAMIR